MPCVSDAGISRISSSTVQRPGLLMLRITLRGSVKVTCQPLLPMRCPFTAPPCSVQSQTMIGALLFGSPGVGAPSPTTRDDAAGSTDLARLRRHRLRHARRAAWVDDIDGDAERPQLTPN